jgi:hypothetical protein
MARKAARFSSLYVAVTSAGAATPVLYAGSWSVNLNPDNIEVTALGDSSKVYVATLPDGSVTYDGFATDTTGTSLLAASIDGQARAWYLYPFEDRTQYVWGTAFLSATLGGDVNGAVTMGGTLAPATGTQLVGF